MNYTVQMAIKVQSPKGWPFDFLGNCHFLAKGVQAACVRISQ